MDIGFLYAAISRNPDPLRFHRFARGPDDRKCWDDLVILAVWRVNVAFTLKKPAERREEKARMNAGLSAILTGLP
jgi:hypothetical protein